jgi:hypothetical protein
LRLRQIGNNQISVLVGEGPDGFFRVSKSGYAKPFLTHILNYGLLGVNLAHNDDHAKLIGTTLLESVIQRFLPVQLLPDTAPIEW